MASKNVIVWAQENIATIGLMAGLGLLAWIMLRGPAKAAEDVGRTAVNVGRGAATGVVDEIGKIVGAPSVYDVTDDPFVARYIIDHPRGGYVMAASYATPAAVARALMLDQFSGHMPQLDSRIYKEFPPTPGGAGGSW